jgi:hypothetical protein
MDAMDAAVTPVAKSASFQPCAIDAINYLLPDVRGALAPYLNVALVTRQHWSRPGGLGGRE